MTKLEKDLNAAWSHTETELVCVGHDTSDDLPTDGIQSRIMLVSELTASELDAYNNAVYGC